MSRAIILNGEYTLPVHLCSTLSNSKGVAIIINSDADFDSTDVFLMTKPTRSTIDPVQLDTLLPGHSWVYYLGGDIDLYLQTSSIGASISATIIISELL